MQTVESNPMFLGAAFVAAPYVVAFGAVGYMTAQQISRGDYITQTVSAGEADPNPNYHYAKKADIGNFGGICSQLGITGKARREAGRYIEKRKQTDPGTANDRGDYTNDELRQALTDFKDGDR